MYLECVLVFKFSVFGGFACRWDVLVGANTGSLEGLRGDLLILVGDEVNAEGELVDVGLLATEIEDANLGVGDTTVEARLRVRLLSIAVSGMFFLVVVVHFPRRTPQFHHLLRSRSSSGSHRCAAAGRIIRTLFLQ